jgi:hypothetical protein
MSKPQNLHKSENRLKKIQKRIVIAVTERIQYKKNLKDTKKFEDEIEKLEILRQKKLDQAAQMLGIDKIDRKIEKLQDQIDELYDWRIRFEDLVIKSLAAGNKVADFILKSIGKRFSVSYKAICEEVFKDDPDGFEEAKAKHGSRKEEYVLIFQGEEVNRFKKESKIASLIKYFKKSA